MMALSTDGKTISGDKINFLSSDESSYPQLTRLYLEFDFRIIEVTKIDDQDMSLHQFTLVYNEGLGRKEVAVTPTFESLTDLESYTENNVIEILQNTVFQSTLAAND